MRRHELLCSVEGIHRAESLNEASCIYSPEELRLGAEVQANNDSKRQDTPSVERAAQCFRTRRNFERIGSDLFQNR